MQNILLLTTIYPLPQGNKGTAVCHFFAREWVKMGYRVRVVHVQSVFPRPFYWLASLFRKQIAAKTGAVVYTRRDSKTSFYEMDGVSIMRVPVYKHKPHGPFSDRAIKKALAELIEWNRSDGFVPDVVIGHFPNPQIEMLGELKEFYPGVKTCMVMHGDIEMVRRIYGERLSVLLPKIDMWGFRNDNVRKGFERRVAKVDNPFLCYSGIPEEYVTRQNTHTFETPLTRFVYVGEMIERKYPSVVVDALCKAYDDGSFHLTYVGEGDELGTIREKIRQLGLQGKVELLGRIPRDKIVEQYDKADCMVMISRWEAYGLVYLEAMARGCITIASRNEGFDGIIQDGVNGFLCKAGDAEELSSVVRRINALTAQERQMISEKAIETARELTDEKAAKR